MAGPRKEDSDSDKPIKPMLKQTPFRMHESDFVRMRELLKIDGMNFQWFINVCTEAYLDRDPRILLLAKEWIEKTKPNRQKASKTFSPRERRAIMDEIQLSDIDLEDDK